MVKKAKSTKEKAVLEPVQEVAETSQEQTQVVQSDQQGPHSLLPGNIALLKLDTNLDREVPTVRLYFGVSPHVDGNQVIVMDLRVEEFYLMVTFISDCINEDGPLKDALQALIPE